MADKEKIELSAVDDDDQVIIVMNDDDGNEYYYAEEMIIPVGDDQYALLIPVDEDGAELLDEDDEDSAFFAKIVPGADGEDEYVEPSDEEFELVVQAYDEIMAQLDEEQSEE